MLHRLQLRKAAGPDENPPEVQKIDVPLVARMLHPLMLKIAAQIRPPVTHLGGTYNYLAKNGNRSAELKADRAILLADGLAKAARKPARQLLYPAASDHLLPTQFGVKKGYACDIPNHRAR